MTMCVPSMTSSFLISTEGTNDARAGTRSKAARARARMRMEIGARLPTQHGEVIVAKKDDEVKKLTTNNRVARSEPIYRKGWVVEALVGEQSQRGHFRVKNAVPARHRNRTCRLRRRDGDTRTMSA